MTQKFVVGDVVEWTSQAAGITRTKQGRVVEVVPPGKRSVMMLGMGLSRNHESYVVHVKGRGKYWPIVSRLTSAHPKVIASSDAPSIGEKE
jgi:hypothetical protein